MLVVYDNIASRMDEGQGSAGQGDESPAPCPSLP